MNHDYIHCLDCINDCPNECFRAQLVRDLDKNPQSWISWGHLRDTDECPINKDSGDD